jgi:hypothetical protein
MGWRAIAILGLLAGCGDGGETCGDDCPTGDCATEPGYAEACEPDLDSCQAPYECAPISAEPETSEVDHRCFKPCADACDCPETCICEGVNGDSSFNADGFCVCI